MKPPSGHRALIVSNLAYPSPHGSGCAACAPADPGPVHAGRGSRSAAVRNTHPPGPPAM